MERAASKALDGLEVAPSKNERQGGGVLDVELEEDLVPEGRGEGSCRGGRDVNWVERSDGTTRTRREVPPCAPLVLTESGLVT